MPIARGVHHNELGEKMLHDRCCTKVYQVVVLGVVPRPLLQAELGGEEEGSWSSTHSQVKHFPFSFSSEDFFFLILK